MRSPSSDPSGHLPRQGGKADSVQRNIVMKRFPWILSDDRYSMATALCQILLHIMRLPPWEGKLSP